ncbi:putative nucleic-acid-binding protein [Microbacteriaceae bacterium SG_E_30_P1]|uniref:Nucleic-acid-binding protein n=1 Tax=Antiquaquibacter oligotrophicus TaxID=2880260 RepID=A0ABT6KJU1_9MICO|nr:type II toxin-antitoxin system VapC family toxin [Antiquaquibacter oligotrophicus]MDH6180079.1 putative nucleic-acid-binding protein [Antiquaquibacter oligotrophicus]UDF14170.1 type II toxin-antitoxin system VapC family toxin [Antiquaquibacter oligotrophicus]
MIGLDTNVLVTYATQDDPRQAALAEKLIEQLTPENPGFVTQIALVESVWVLRRLFEADDQSISTFVGRLLNSRDLVIENADAARRALDETRGSVEFTDALLAQTGLAAGCDYTVTFDRRASKVDGMRLAATVA